jgi:hypothetical protein
MQKKEEEIGEGRKQKWNGKDEGRGKDTKEAKRKGIN